MRIKIILLKNQNLCLMINIWKLKKQGNNQITIRTKIFKDKVHKKALIKKK